jgi:SOS response regulatory protein OraA/RecX
MNSSCGGCDELSTGDISKTIQTAIQFLAQGHSGVSELYKALARKAIHAEDRDLYLEEAAKHDRITQEITECVIPDEGEQLHGQHRANSEFGGA